jgi:ABC-type transporter Mla MlaB component
MKGAPLSLGSRREPTAITLVVGGSIGPADVPRLCARLRAVLEAAEGGIVVCDLVAITRADLGTLEVLARLQLTARRCGGRMRLRRCSPELTALLAFTGLGALVPVDD